MPLEAEGIRRAADLQRMLPSEAHLWRRRRRLLAARLAEHTLLAYQHRQFDTEPSWVREPQQVRERRRRELRPTLEQGPLILCVDTSASMRGGTPSRWPRRWCWRRCVLPPRAGGVAFAFSGPGDVLEFDLSGGLDGLLAAADFLGRSFHGGTDVGEPLERALAAIEAGPWGRADLLLATDGEFGAGAALVERLRTAKRSRSLRVQGVLMVTARRSAWLKSAMTSSGSTTGAASATTARSSRRSCQQSDGAVLSWRLHRSGCARVPGGSPLIARAAEPSRRGSARCRIAGDNRRHLIGGPMDDQTALGVMQRFGKAFFNRDPVLLAAAITEDAEWHFAFGSDGPDGRVRKGVDGFLQGARENDELFERLRFDNVVCRGMPADRLVMTYLIDGKRRGGDTFSLRGIELITVRDGRLAVKDVFWKGTRAP